MLTLRAKDTYASNVVNNKKVIHQKYILRLIALYDTF